MIKSCPKCCSDDVEKFDMMAQLCETGLEKTEYESKNHKCNNCGWKWWEEIKE